MCNGFTNQSCVGRPRNGSNEETPITTALHPPKWWFRYVDDSHSCLKKDQVDAFHQHLNSINANIQFTLELEDANGSGLPFLDTITSRRVTATQVEVYRKPTHTDRYLDFLSHHPSCHKRSVVKTLLLRARNIPSTNKGKREEAQRVKAVLRENNYPSGFIKECEGVLGTKPSQPTTNCYVVLRYVKGVSERIGRVLKQQSLRVSFQPQRTINSLFPRPKQQDETDRSSSGIVYRINCSLCDFVYYGQTERALKTRIYEHKKAVLMFDHYSKLACHVHEHHHMDFKNVEVVGHEAHYHQRLFLEAWMSVKDPNAGNDHMVTPKVYKCLERT